MENTKNVQAAQQAEPRSDTAVGSNPWLAEAAKDTETCYLMAMIVCSPEHHDAAIRADAKQHAHLIISKWKQRASANSADTRNPAEIA
jgi:hypothetical protein